MLSVAAWSGAAQAADSPEPAERLLPDLHLSISEVPGEVSLRLPLASESHPLYREYRFLRGRLESGVGRGLLQREPDSADFRAGFSIRLD
jgi:hypothetical protein